MRNGTDRACTCYLSLPQAQRAVLGAGGVELAVGREAHAMHRPEVALEALDLLARVEVELVQLEVLAAADEDALFAQQAGRVDRARDVHLLERAARLQVQKGHLVAVSQRDDVARGRELHAADGTGDGHLLAFATGTRVPEAQGLVISAADQLLRACVGEEHLLDVRGVAFEGDRGLARLLAVEVEEPELLVVATRGEHSTVGAEVDALDDVLVLERARLFARGRVPDLGGEVCGARGGQRGIRVEIDAPDGALVALKGAHPVAGVTLAQHGLPVLAGRDAVVGRVVLRVELGEGQEDDGTSVAGTGQRSLAQQMSSAGRAAVGRRGRGHDEVGCGKCVRGDESEGSVGVGEGGERVPGRDAGQPARAGS